MHIERIGETNHRVGGRFRKMSPHRIASQRQNLCFQLSWKCTQKKKETSRRVGEWFRRMGPHGGQDLCVRFHGGLWRVNVTCKVTVAMVSLFELKIWKTLEKPCLLINYCYTIGGNRTVKNKSQVIRPLHKSSTFIKLLTIVWL